MTTITKELVATHGLSDDEYALILKTLGREPTLTELGVFSAMWSEHCSYKSSRRWLKQLPTRAPHVICGPGENAGVIDIGQGQAVVFKMESHNHPSFIEPFHGAATGVGGVLRDIFTMGARPVALMNALRFGAPDHPRTRHLVAGVAAGIGGYGNCVGVPTVGGEVNFHPSYNGNILVNVMAVGVADVDKIFYSAAVGVGNPVVYVGAKTGRDGVHGAAMASANFDSRAEERRPTIQIGDPFLGKLLIEACLELMQTDAIVAIQDMGAAGLTSSSVEMASRGGVGIALDLDKAPTREQDMTAYELMLSESQERMLMVLGPNKEEAARAVFEKWGLNFAVIGTLTDCKRLTLKHRDKVVCDLPIDSLVEASPSYDRPWVKTPAPAPAAPPAAKPWAEALRTLLACPDLASRRWFWEQYDHTVMADTLQAPGGDAAVTRLHGSKRALAIATDCTPRYVAADAVEGGKQAVAEAWRNVTAVGARPLAITDNMNFGDPEKPEIMGQFVGACRGLTVACEALDIPVVSGNVSFYNETEGRAIAPAPVIGCVGVLDDIDQMATIALRRDGEVLLVIGDQPGTPGWMGQSLYLREIEDREGGAPPPVDLAHEKRAGDLTRALIGDALTDTVHDVSDGGLLCAVAEMAMAGGRGVALVVDPDDLIPVAFGETQGRYVVAASTDAAREIARRCQSTNVGHRVLGTVGGSSFTLNGETAGTIQALTRLNEAWLPRYMAKPS